MLLPLELSANRALDLPMGLIRGGEDSVRVVETERAMLMFSSSGTASIAALPTRYKLSWAL